MNIFFERKCRECGRLMKLMGESRYGNDPYWKCESCEYKEDIIKYRVEWDMEEERMKESKYYPFDQYDIIYKKRGICCICSNELYYGIGILRPGRGDLDICTSCFRKMREIMIDE